MLINIVKHDVNTDKIFEVNILFNKLEIIIDDNVPQNIERVQCHQHA